MIQILKWLTALLVAAVVAACGGGGGSSGTTGGTGGGTGGGVVVPAVPTLTLSLVNSSDAAIAGNTISSTAPVFAKAVLKDGNGAAVVNKLVTFSGNTALVKFSPVSGTVLTDASGVAKIQVSPASPTAAGAGTISVAATLENPPADPTALVANLDVQVASSSTPQTPTLTLSVVNAAGVAVPDNSVTNGNVVFAKAVVKDALGAAVGNKLVIFSSSTGLTKFQPVSGQVLTDASGVAKVQLVPSSLTTSGAETLTAATSVNNSVTGVLVNLSASVDIQTAPANVALVNFVATQPTLSAFQSTPVTVDVTVNGAAATTTPVQVTFTASCGTFSPAQAFSNSAGRAITTFQATGCSAGTVAISATATGATPVTTNLTIQTAPPTNLLFVTANPTTIYTLQAAFGVKQSTVQFKVVDAGGNGVGPGTQVNVSLSASAIAAGVTFADTGTTAAKVLTTDVNGFVNAIVKAGSVPTPLSVNATIVGTAITASSANLSVNSGQPVQNFFSLSTDTFNPEGLGYDGEVVNLQVFVADRLGQPVPAGTPISFITEGGQVTASCFVSIDANNKSGCAVSLITQAFRPLNGRVTVLAYTEGEEVFIDTNGNNKFDPATETFYDMGQPFLDANEDGLYNVGEQKVGDPSTPGAGIGSSACAPAGHPYLVANIPGTCDGAWGPTRVRQQLFISFSGSFAAAPNFFDVSVSGVSLTLKDVNGNSMPKGTTVSATISGGTNCSVQEVIPSVVPSTTNPTVHRVIISKGNASGDTCVGAEVSVKATTPKNNQTLLGKVVISAP